MKLNFIKYKLQVYTFLLMYVSLRLSAQDTTLLHEVDIVVIKNDLSAIGKKSESLDSLVKRSFVFSNLGEVLSLNSHIYIKNYGPGALSSTALRGGNASQTGVLWNGINIQNSMLGQLDLALLPSMLFENVDVEYGGSSSLWGSGAVAGSILLHNSPKFNKGLTTKVNLSSGSFGLLNASTNVEFSKARFYSSTKAYLQNSNNNYRYKDTLNKEKPIQELKNAAYSFKGLMQEFKYLLTAKQSISFDIWYSMGVRQIPAFNELKVIPAVQSDDDLRSNVRWNYNCNKWNNSVKAAYINNRIKYDDSLLVVHSVGKTQTIILENENTYNWAKNNILNLGVNYTNYAAQSNNYNGQKMLSKVSFVAGNKFSMLNNKLIVYPVVRAEYFSVGSLPVTGNIGAEYFVFKSLSLKANAARVYRQPTFNELYWYPGGNKDLLAEQGYTYEGDITYRNKWKHWQLECSGSIFSRTIDNWILWLPGPHGSPTPMNIQQVWSRGTETRTKLMYTVKEFFIAGNVSSSYVLSTIHSTAQENTATEDRQLIYTPRYTINSNFTVGYNGVTFTYYHQYVGYRFITSDNTQWLDPYHYSGLRMNINTMLRGETKVVIFGACNNLFNTNYSVVSGRYMPLRNFELGISLISNKPNKKKEIIN